MHNASVFTAALAAVATLAVPVAYAQATSAQGQGEVVRITTDKIAIRHGAIEQLDLPAMTLNFLVDPALTKGLAVGDKVKFTAQREGKGYRITEIKK